MIDTNQPESAFPSTFKSLSPEEGQVHRWGMTLRDYFAAKASEDDIAEHSRKGFIEKYVFDLGNGRKELRNREARLTREQAKYRYADAMLAAREAA